QFDRGSGRRFKPRLEIERETAAGPRFEHQDQLVTEQRAAVCPPVKIGEEPAPFWAVVKEPHAAVPDADITCGPVFPEVYAGDALMPEPDRLVMFMADRIGVPHPGQARTRWTDERKEIGARAPLAVLKAGSLDAVQPK